MSNNMRITVPETLLLTSESPKFSPAARMMVSDRHIVIVYSNIELDNSKLRQSLLTPLRINDNHWLIICWLGLLFLSGTSAWLLVLPLALRFRCAFCPFRIIFFLDLLLFSLWPPLSFLFLLVVLCSFSRVCWIDFVCSPGEPLPLHLHVCMQFSIRTIPKLILEQLQIKLIHQNNCK